MIKSAVIGDPISHSLSPFLHEFFLKKYNINGSYEKIKVESKNLEKSLDNLLFEQNYAGLNVTIPHKEEIFKIFKNRNYQINENALLTNSINTIYKEDNKIVGDSSDGFGFVKNLEFFCDKTFINKQNKSVVIFGAGGAARSIIPSLNKIGFTDFYIKNRSKKRATELQNLFPNYNINLIENISEIKNNVDILINTTSLGMKNQPPLIFDINEIAKTTIICDIVYNPLLTDLLKNAKKNNFKIITGIGMLIFQAMLGFEKWFEVKPELNKDEFQQLSQDLISHLDS